MTDGPAVQLLDFYPLKGTFKPGERAGFQLVMQSDRATEAHVRLTVWFLARIVATASHHLALVPGKQRPTVTWQPPANDCCGYGIAAELLDPSGRPLERAVTAFDVLDKWTDHPRYGFLTDFSPARRDIRETVDTLVRYHVNGLQFYDWQFRHDQLMPPECNYIDPLGRHLSLETVAAFIDTAHERGLAAMPYLAIYAASMDFWHAHGEWAMYDEQGQKLAFMDFLGLMDPTAGRPWSAHLLRECAAMLDALPFDGLHVDQYGDPKTAYDVAGRSIDIPAAFADFIQALKRSHGDKACTFNAVGNWPIAELAKSAIDFVYIEIWPPDTGYRDVAEIVLNARRLSGGKAIVIALYLPAARPANILLTDALIFSCGGSRIELGEKARLLADPYFPNHEPLSADFCRTLRKYYDFAVRYSNLIGPSAGEEIDRQVNVPVGIWHQARSSAGKLTICLVNFRGLGDAGWDEAHLSPIPQANVAITVSIPDGEGPVGDVLWASVDEPDPALQRCEWHWDDGMVQVTLPRIVYWAILVVTLDSN